MTTAQLNLPTPRALVTGATSGIGKAIALQLARDGFEVIVHGRDAARGARTVAEIELGEGRARFVPADLRDPADIPRLAAAAGDIDVLVNNGGFSTFGPTATFEVETFDAMFASNVRAPFLLVAEVAPGMLERGRGSIINISSMAARVGVSGAAAYSATKASLSALTRSWAVEFSPAVRVNAVAPGPVHTGGTVPERTEALARTTLLNRAGDAEEIAEVVGFLASPRASYVTGAVFAVDGGRSAI